MSNAGPAVNAMHPEKRSPAAISDALVFFGATGDLAYKQIFPSLQHMIKRGNLNVPVIGVAKAGWNLDQLRARARDSLAQHGGVDEAAFSKLIELLQYIDGDYQDMATFEQLSQTLGKSLCPVHYLAIPPSAFATVVVGLSKSGCSKNARVIGSVRKPSGPKKIPSRPYISLCQQTGAHPWSLFRHYLHIFYYK